MLRIDSEEYKHLRRVLRHRIGDEVMATTGRGWMYRCRISSMGPGYATLEIVERWQNRGEPRFRLTLAPAIHKFSRFELLLEKGTEIGVGQFQPIFTAFSQQQTGASKVSRWERILKSAVKQCGRSCLPALLPPCSFDEFLARTGAYDYRWIAHVPAPAGAPCWTHRSAVGEAAPGRTGVVATGPEGGFSDQEIEAALHAGFQFLSLGSRRLRAETAGLVAASLLLAQFGDLQ